MPSGSDARATHIAMSFYKDAAQLASFMEGSGATPDLKTQLAVKEGMKTREWKSLRVETMLMMIR